jgi:hypothetical protein
MSVTNLQHIANTVVRRAERQGSVAAEEIQEELVKAGQSEALWQDVVTLARTALNFRQGRYHYVAPVSDRLRQDQQRQRRIQRTITQLIRQHRAVHRHVERRKQDRVDFVQPVTVQAEDQRCYTLLSRDLSPTGIRLIGTRRLLGQKVLVGIPCAEGPSQEFVVRILWTAAIGDDLFENGGMFLEAHDNETN